MTLPAIGALRERWPEAHIEILGYSHIIELACGRYYADATRSIEARALAGFFVPGGELDRNLAEYFGSFQLVISYLYDPDEIFAGNVRRCGVRQLITASPRPTDLPAAAHYCKPLEALAIYVTDPRPRLYLSDADRARGREFFQHAGREPIVAMHPGSGAARKNWPAEKFGALGRWLMDELAVQLVIVHGEADDEPVRQLREQLGSRPVRVAQGLRLIELAGVLAQATMFIGNDSGITHMAVALGIPTVVLFGPTSDPRWQPQPGVGPVRVVRFGPNDLAAARQAAEELWAQRHATG